MYVSLRQSGQERRRGVVLLAVLLVVAILTLAAFRFSEAMVSEARAVDSYEQSNQARLLADAGINYTAALMATQSTQSVLNGTPTNNPDYFQGILVRDSDIPARRGRFSIVSPLPPFDPNTSTTVGQTNTPFLYGVTDEAGKINLNALVQLDSSGYLLYNALYNLSQYDTNLSGLTPTIIWSIYNWISPQANESTLGSPSSVYLGKTPPYTCKNAPLDSVEELLLVDGMTQDLLFGNDTNRNGILTQAQQNAGAGSVINRGLSGYVTVYSRELNISAAGVPRVWVNDTNLPTLLTNLQTVLDPDVANYIVAYRLYGSTASAAASGSSGTTTTATLVTGSSSSGSSPTFGNGSTSISITLSGSNNTNTTANAAAPAPIAWSDGKAAIQTAMNNLSSTSKGKTIASLYDLVNSTVTIPGSGQGAKSTVINSPFSDPDSIRQNLPQVLDQVTTSNLSEIPARININTAPSAVIASIPTASQTGTPTALTTTQISAIITTLQTQANATSGQAPDPIYLTPAWLLTETSGAFTPAQVSAMAKYITASSQVFRVQSVGYFDGPGPSVRIEAVIDTNAGRPRIIYYRDLTSLGKGYDLTSAPNTPQN